MAQKCRFPQASRRTLSLRLSSTAFWTPLPVRIALSTIYYLLALYCTVLYCIMHRPTYQPTALCMHLTRNDKLLLCMRACCYNTLCLLIVSSLHTALRVCLSVCLAVWLSVCVCDSCRAAWLRGLGELHGGRRRGHRDAQRHMEHNRL